MYVHAYVKKRMDIYMYIYMCIEGRGDIYIDIYVEDAEKSLRPRM